jgi:hypothetical protein
LFLPYVPAGNKGLNIYIYIYHVKSFQQPSLVTTMSSSIYVVFYFITCVSTESSLGCSKDRIDQVEYSIFTNNSETFQIRTGNILRIGDNVLTMHVDLGNNTILCSKIFDKLRNLKSVFIQTTNVVEIETNFLQGKGLDSRLDIRMENF